MISEIFLLCFDVIISLLVIPLIIIFLAPFQLYKSGVRLLVKIFHPHWLPLGENDPFTVWDIIKPFNGRHVYNVGVAVRVHGKVTLQRIQQRVSAEVLCETKNGEKRQPRLYEEFVLFGGYAFRKPIPKLDINQQIRQVNLENSTLAAFKADWIELPYGKGAAPWEILLIPQDEVGETILLMKIHHALADAYSLLYIFNSFLDNIMPEPPREPEDSFWDITRQLLKAVRISTIFNSKVCRASSDLPRKSNSPESSAHVATTSLYFPDMKLIQRKTGAQYSAIMLTIFGGVLHRVLTESKTGNSRVENPDNQATFVQLSFPWPNHPLKILCNHWTSGGICVPLGKMRAIDRLKAVDKDYNDFMGSDMPKILKRFMFPMGAVFPVKLFRWGFEWSRRFTGLRTIFTSVMAYSENYYELDGNPVFSVSPLTGLLGTTPVISGLAFAYKDQVQCSFIASPALAKDQASMDRIVKTYFADEVEKLVEELGEYNGN